MMMSVLQMTPEITFATLVQTHHAGVWRYLRMLGCSREQADDLTQETFIVLMRREFEHRSDPETASFLRRTARNLWLQDRRSKLTRREVALEQAELAMQRNAPDGGDAYLTALEHCLETLKGRARAAIVAVYRERKSYAEAAQALEMRENGLKTLLQRAREALRQCIRTRTGGGTP